MHDFCCVNLLDDKFCAKLLEAENGAKSLDQKCAVH